jgi:putative transposase
MSRKYKFHDSGKLYFVSFAVVYWIDLFIRQEYKNIVLDSWKFCINNKGMELYGWCMMSSHIHMIIVTNKEKLEDIMRDMKRHTSVQLR